VATKRRYLLIAIPFGSTTVGVVQAFAANVQVGSGGGTFASYTAAAFDAGTYAPQFAWTKGDPLFSRSLIGSSKDTVNNMALWSLEIDSNVDELRISTANNGVLKSTIMVEEDIPLDPQVARVALLSGLSQAFSSRV